MMIGEIDYGSIIVEAKNQYNEETGAPLVPIPGFSAAIVCMFCVMVSVLLMNLLVSVRLKFLLNIICGYQCDKAVTKNDTREMIWYDIISLQWNGWSVAGRTAFQFYQRNGRFKVCECLRWWYFSGSLRERKQPNTAKRYLNKKSKFAGPL